MKKRLSQREKIMLVFLVVIILVVLWYKFVSEPVRNQIADLNTATADEQTSLEAGMLKMVEMNKMQKYIDQEKETGEADPIPFYDNGKNLMLLLNGVLSSALDCSLDFHDVETEEYLVSRKVDITFTTATYAQTRAIINKINSDTYTNQISDITLTVFPVPVEGANVKTRLTVTFYEIAK